ncbi:MAG TPA: butyrate kinase [candidate division WOR-3 bacterium]|uniref:Probable butyrate kinase n=1 Tax=candidate division WOR-3 bacterium TaxID=2052148 RepID=A0A7V0T484_UNCW3|nr:butyrate kinase [candidate division WOR-3 bacterium]
MVILAINPGGGSTKVAVFRNKQQLLSENIVHPPAQLSRYKMVLDQYQLRKEAVLQAIAQLDIRVPRKTGSSGREGRSQAAAARAATGGLKLDAIVSRGGPLQPMAGGVYRVTVRVVSDIRRGRVQTLHPSLLGPIVSYELAEDLGVPAYFVDPESTDEFWDVARVSGLKGIERRSLSHALSCRTVAKATARKLKRPYEKCNFVVVHLGTGFTVAAHVKGRQVDASNANTEGPLSPQRAGTLPSPALVRLCFSGRYSEGEVLDLLQRKGGLYSYFGTDDVPAIETLVAKRNRQASLVYEAMLYQIAKEIGAQVAVCRGSVDAIILTGGLTQSRRLVTSLKKWIGGLCSRIYVYPGEEEMAALNERMLAVLNGTEKPRDYEQAIAVR